MIDDLIVALAVLGVYVVGAVTASVALMAAWIKWGPRD